MQVQSCNPRGMTVDPKTYNACTFEIIDKWDPTKHAKTCDTMFYLRDGTGAYVWDCDKWIFLDFTGYIAPDWKAEEGENGHIKNKPFQTLGNGLEVDENGVLSVSDDAFAQSDWKETNAGSPAFIKNKPDISAGLKREQIQQYFSSRVVLDKYVEPDTYTVHYSDENGVVQTVDIPVEDVSWFQYLPNRSHMQPTSVRFNDEQQLSLSVSSTYRYPGIGLIVRSTDNSMEVELDGVIHRIVEIEFISVGILNFYILPDRLQSDWNETDQSSEAFIKNKPTIPTPVPQVQSDWDVTDSTKTEFIKNKPTIPEEQVQSNWNETNSSSKAFIQNKPTIPPAQVQSDWNVTDTNSKAFIKNKPVIPEGAVLYPSTGQNTNGAMTQKATTDELAKKANVTDLAKYVTLDTNQTITGKKVFTGMTDFKSNVSSKLQVVQRFILANEAGESVQTQGAFYMNPRLGGQASNGFGVGMGFGGLTIIGGGEAHRGLLEAIETPETTPPALGTINGGHEHAVLVGDSNVYIGTGYQSAGSTGYWWKFDNTGKAFSPSGAEILDKTYGDKLYVSLTEVNHVLGETTFDNVKASSDTNGWVTITDRKNGFTGGTIKYKRHMNVVTIQGDNINCPALAQFSPKVICNIPDGARITDGKPTGSGHVSNVAMGFHAETNGDVYIHNSAALTTAMHANFTFTYVV